MSSSFRHSVAFTSRTADELRQLLVRSDGQEDLCVATYRPSTGSNRTTALLNEIITPMSGETSVHGNVSFTGDYVLRALQHPAKTKSGIAILHSHPGAHHWQEMSRLDADAEASYANLVREVTGLPLVGMTLATGDGTWSARAWSRGTGREVEASPCESVRVLGRQLHISWNNDLVPMPAVHPSQERTVSCWGPRVQADLARMRILIVGAGTLGLDVALRLAALGIQHIGLLDFDVVKLINVDRMIGATYRDVLLRRPKVNVAARLVAAAATARPFLADPMHGSICETELLQRALDFDLIFCCVDDHPWPRSVLNAIAYSDLVPVIDGGLHVDVFDDTGEMRNATWRSHVLRPGRPCMSCNGQLDLGKVLADRAGLLDDSGYIAGLPRSERPQSQNVAALSASATGALLAQFVSLMVAPADIGEPGPLRYSLSTNWLERVAVTQNTLCPVEQRALVGDARQVILEDSPRAGSTSRATVRHRLAAGLIRTAGFFIDHGNAAVDRLAERLVRRQHRTHHRRARASTRNTRN